MHDTADGSTAAVVCDTDAASFVTKVDPVRGPRYLGHLENRSVILSFCTVAELRLGAELGGWGARRRERVEQFVSRSVVYYPDEALCDLWAGLVADLRRRGRPIAQHDAWVVVTALILDVPVVTHHASHFQGIPALQVLTEPDP